MRAKVWICSRISALDGRSAGLTHCRQRRLAALRLAVKYSDSMRSYINRAASSAITWRSLTLAIPFRRRYQAHQCGAGLRVAAKTGRRLLTLRVASPFWQRLLLVVYAKRSDIESPFL